jgi:hypothetical protein
MEEDLRSRRSAKVAIVARGFGLCGLMLLAACSESPKLLPHSDPHRHDVRKISIDDYNDAQIVAAVIEECHAPIKKRMQQVTASVKPSNERRIIVQADLPHLVRIYDGKQQFLLRDQSAYRMDETAITAEERERLQQIAKLVDAAAFGPLYRATSCRRSGDDFVLSDQRGNKTIMRLHENSLLPSAFVYPDQLVQIGDYLRTKTTWVARWATVDPLGTCEVVFEDGGVVFDAELFQPPESAKQEPKPNRIRMPAPGNATEQEQTTPTLMAGKATQLILIADPGDWPTRHSLYQPIHDELEAQGQQIAGFPMMFEDEGKRWLAVPFRQRKRGKALIAPANWRIDSSDASRMLVVYPQNGDLHEKMQKGSQTLTRALANRNLTAIGPLVTQPFVHLHSSPPTKEKLSSCKVRVSVRIK